MTINGTLRLSLLSKDVEVADQNTLKYYPHRGYRYVKIVQCFRPSWMSEMRQNCKGPSNDYSGTVMFITN
jgi:hypothetical protein